jgi:hypothetical protein
MMTFTQVAALIWLGGIAMLTGEPARVAKNFSKPAPGFIAEVSTRHPDRHRRQRRLDRRLAAHAPLALARRRALEPRPDHDLGPADCCSGCPGSISAKVTVASAPTFAKRWAPVPAASRDAAWDWRSAPRSTISTAFARWAAAAPPTAAGMIVQAAPRSGKGHPGLDPDPRNLAPRRQGTSGCGCIAATSS